MGSATVLSQPPATTHTVHPCGARSCAPTVCKRVRCGWGLLHPFCLGSFSVHPTFAGALHGGGRASRPPVARLLHSERVAAFIFPIGGSAPCSASATPPVLVSLTAVSKELLAQTQPTCAGLRGVAPGSTPLPSPRARKIIVSNRGAPSCGAPTPQAAPLPRYFVGAGFPVERSAGPKLLLFSRGCPPFRFAPLPRLGWSFRHPI